MDSLWTSDPAYFRLAGASGAHILDRASDLHGMPSSSCCSLDQRPLKTTRRGWCRNARNQVLPVSGPAETDAQFSQQSLPVRGDGSSSIAIAPYAGAVAAAKKVSVALHLSEGDTQLRLDVGWCCALHLDDDSLAAAHECEIELWLSSRQRRERTKAESIQPPRERVLSSRVAPKPTVCMVRAPLLARAEAR